MQYMFSLPLSRHLENFEKYILQNTAFFWRNSFSEHYLIYTGWWFWLVWMFLRGWVNLLAKTFEKQWCFIQTLKNKPENRGKWLNVAFYSLGCLQVWEYPGSSGSRMARALLWCLEPWDVVLTAPVLAVWSLSSLNLVWGQDLTGDSRRIRPLSFRTRLPDLQRVRLWIFMWNLGFRVSVECNLLHILIRKKNLRPLFFSLTYLEKIHNSQFLNTLAKTRTSITSFSHKMQLHH